MRPEADGDGVIEVLIDDDTAAFHRGSPGLPIDLQHHVVESDGIVAIDRSFGLNRENAPEVFSDARDKGRLVSLLRENGKAAVELTYVAPF